MSIIFEVLDDHQPTRKWRKNKKVLEDPVKADPRPIDFAKLDKPGFWSSKLSKGPKTTTWIWNLHADAHDFDVHTGDAESTENLFSSFWTSCSHFYMDECCIFPWSKIF